MMWLHHIMHKLIHFCTEIISMTKPNIMWLEKKSVIMLCSKKKNNLTQMEHEI